MDDLVHLGFWITITNTLSSQILCQMYKMLLYLHFYPLNTPQSLIGTFLCLLTSHQFPLLFFHNVNNRKGVSDRPSPQLWGVQHCTLIGPGEPAAGCNESWRWAPVGKHVCICMSQWPLFGSVSLPLPPPCLSQRAQARPLCMCVCEPPCAYERGARALPHIDRENEIWMIEHEKWKDTRVIKKKPFNLIFPVFKKYTNRQCDKMCHTIDSNIYI